MTDNISNNSDLDFNINDSLEDLGLNIEKPVARKPLENIDDIDVDALIAQAEIENQMKQILEPLTQTRGTARHTNNEKQPVGLNKEGDNTDNKIDNEVDNELMTKISNDELDALKKRISDLEQKSLRIAADAANSAKQAELDIANAKKIAKKSLVKDVLPFMTSAVLSFAYIPQNEEALKFVNTLKGSLDKLSKDLGGHGIEFIVPQIGELFDPSTMQALNSPSESVSIEDAKIANVASVGCKVDGQLISPASILLS